MDPVITKILEGIPYAGMGSTLERNALIGYVRNLINESKYTVEMILSMCENVGYSRQMAEDVFKELTGLSPTLIINNNDYYNGPSYLPCCSIAWGYSKTKHNFVNFVKPYSYGYAVFEKNENDSPEVIVISATIPEAIDELKKVAKGIQTLDKIITKKLLETEDVPTNAETPHQVNKPYAASPLQILKKNFKDKVINVSEFERQASKLLASEEITVDEAEDLMAWKQDLIDEDETYGNDVLELNEQWKPVGAEDIDENAPDYEERVQEAYKQLAGMIEETDILADFAKRTGIERLFDAYLELGKEVAGEWDVKPEAVFGEIALSAPELTKKLADIDKENFNKEVETWKKSQEEFPWKGGNNQASKKVKSKQITVNVYDIDWDVNEDSTGEYAADELPDFWDSITINVEDENDDNEIEDKIANFLSNEYGFTVNGFHFTKKASKKVTAENMDLDDIEAEDNKDEVQEQIEKINEKPVEEIFSEITPEQYFEDALNEDKVNTINEVVSKCIDKFSEKFKDFDKYNVEILSYNTKVLGTYKPNTEEMVEDKELNANAILQVILSIVNNADETNVKKALAVFSVTNGELHWTGTIRGENDQVVAFTEEGLDALFEVEEPSEDELEDIISI